MDKFEHFIAAIEADTTRFNKGKSLSVSEILEYARKADANYKEELSKQKEKEYRNLISSYGIAKENK